MKVTKKDLRRIIREEKSKLLKEGNGMGLGWGFGDFTPNHKPDFAKSYGKDARVIGQYRNNNKDLTEQPISGRQADQMAGDQALSDAFKELQEIIHDASLAMDRWVDNHHAALDAAGELDNPDSITIRMDELRIDLKAIADEAYKRR
tara:strand:+ start:8857 stop:9297 length:441 start_codon:yes stop_codon:yes gene_type:complete